MGVGRVPELQQRALMAAHQNGEDVLLVTGRGHRRMVAVREQEGVAVAGHHHPWVATLVVEELTAEARLWPEAVVIDLLELGLLGRALLVVLVRRGAGPAAGIAVALADQEVAGAPGAVVAEEMEDAAPRVGGGGADLHHLPLFGEDAEGGVAGGAAAAGDGHLAGRGAPLDDHLGTRAGVDRIGLPGPDVG